MRRFALTILVLAASGAAIPRAQADMVGAAAGAGTGLVVAGPIGAAAGGIVGAVYGKPFWGPPVSHRACWVDSRLHRHCRWRYSR
jgi:hypothetical protein